VSAVVSVIYLGDPQFEQVLRNRLQEFMESYEGQWIIRVRGSQQKERAELRTRGKLSCYSLRGNRTSQKKSRSLESRPLFGAVLRDRISTLIRSHVASPAVVALRASSSSSAPKELIMGRRIGAIARVNDSTRFSIVSPFSSSSIRSSSLFRFLA
jgi:hypothetical protein